jgi:D-serine deaminase-like pyridoxal phosphate-dependent protein
MQAAYSLPDSDILLGKPMPVAGVEHFYSQIDQLDSTFNPDTQVHWLIDSTVRLQQYAELAQRLDRPMQINLEIDIGLHRGGYEDMSAFITSLEIIRDASHLTLTGLMGYEAYICKIPSFLGGAKKAFSNAQNKYQEFTQQVKQTLSLDNLDHLILNTGGSSTYPLYEDNNISNELACASALVKPTDFDVFTLDDHLPAAFIATPVLKVVDQPNLPMASGLSRFLRKLNLSPQSSCFIYGGNWLASPCHPANAKVSSILGHSSNQEMYDLPNDCSLKQDDFMFFRPSQSEAVLLQFGKIAIYDQGKITHWWDVFSNS